MAGGGKSSRLIGSLTRESRTGGGEGGREGSSPDLARKEKEGGSQILLLDRELVGLDVFQYFAFCI